MNALRCQCFPKVVWVYLGTSSENCKQNVRVSVPTWVSLLGEGGGVCIAWILGPGAEPRHIRTSVARLQQRRHRRKVRQHRIEFCCHQIRKLRIEGVDALADSSQRRFLLELIRYNAISWAI